MDKYEWNMIFEGGGPSQNSKYTSVGTTMTVIEFKILIDYLLLIYIYKIRASKKIKINVISYWNIQKLCCMYIKHYFAVHKYQNI